MKMRINKKGFSLTEVLVAVLVLTMAVVSASNFLVSMMKSNAMNTSVLQAYYYSVEGLEAFRNIRDTYFMNYLDFCGSGDTGDNGGIFLEGGFCEERRYVVSQNNITGGEVLWDLESVGNEGDVSDNGEIGLISEPGIPLSVTPDAEENVLAKKFYRVCDVKNIQSKAKSDAEDTSDDAKQITCTTKYEDGSKTGEVSLKTILTDWKE